MIDGNLFKKAVLSGAYHLQNHKNEVDELNVFPVPDGDTGTNMSMTAMAAAELLQTMEDPTVAQVAQQTASSMLRGARGNSGVILSLLFRGIARGLKSSKNLTSKRWVSAMKAGVEEAYKAVMKPTEGTILTVARVAMEEIEKADQPDCAKLFGDMLRAAEKALQETPNILPVLQKAGVVDAGGKGLVLLFEGMLRVLEGKEGVSLKTQEPSRKLQSPAAEFEGEITFTYCTEYIVNCSEQSADALALRAYLESIGDSVVVVDDGAIIKVHLHTDHPGKAIEEGLTFGPLQNLKIDNMRMQHQNKAQQARQSRKDDAYRAVDPDILYGFVAVGAGQGIRDLFLDLGADQVVSGGQTMNPSTEDLLQAIHATPAKTVFVLPNNKNIILTADQTVKLADRQVCVLQTKTIPEGIAAMLAFNPEADLNANCVDMTKAFDRVTTGLVTFASRDSEFDGKKIRKNDILAMHNKRILAVEQDVNRAAYRLIKKLTRSQHRFLTILYGADVTQQQAQKLLDAVYEKYADHLEVNLIQGGQPVYYYMISLE